MTFEKLVIGDNDDLEELKNNIEDIGITAQGLGSLNYPSGKLRTIEFLLSPLLLLLFRILFPKLLSGHVMHTWHVSNVLQESCVQSQDMSVSILVYYKLYSHLCQAQWTLNDY